MKEKDSREGIYEEARKDPVAFWEKIANELFWSKKWRKAFDHSPPFFEWFPGGESNITVNIFEKNKLGWEKIKGKPAIIWIPEPVNEPPITLTYEELFKKVCKLALGLKELGVKKGDRVVIYLPHFLETAISMLACARIGAVHVVISPTFSTGALNERLKLTEAKILITADGYYKRGEKFLLKPIADSAILHTNVEKIIVVKRLDEEIVWDIAKNIWWHDILEEEKEFIEPEYLDSEDPLFILIKESEKPGSPDIYLFTSGGYMVQSYWTGKWIFDFQFNDTIWSTHPLDTIYGQTFGIYSPLLNGLCTILFEGNLDWPIVDRWAHTIEHFPITIFFTSPLAIKRFKKYCGEIAEIYRFDNLKIIGSSGEELSENFGLWYFKNIGKERCPLINGWGQTECGGILISPSLRSSSFKPEFVGRPLPGIRMEILDEEGRICKEGEEGNLVILPPFAPGMFKELYTQPIKYQEKYWSIYGPKVFFTQDRAFKDKNGEIKIVKRVDDSFKIEEQRINLKLIEEIVISDVDVIRAAAISVFNEIGERELVLFVVYGGQKTLEREKYDLRMKIWDKLGKAFVPKEIIFVNDLPQNKSGKIFKEVLEKLYLGEKVEPPEGLVNYSAFEEIKKQFLKRKRLT
jgi:acetyl-CoA synthetase